MTASEQNPIAPLWHTMLLIVFFFGLGAAGLLFQKYGVVSFSKTHPDTVPLYLSLLALEWGSVFFVWRGIRLTGTRLRDVVGGRWDSAKAVWTDIGLALGVGAVWIGINIAANFVFGPSHAKSIDALLPQSPAEIGLWIAVSVSAGFREETAFRGYLQKQLAAFTGSGILAVILQAIVFAAGHAYEGGNAVAYIAVLGTLLGILALWRKSLRPGMIFHAVIDTIGGILPRFI